LSEEEEEEEEEKEKEKDEEEEVEEEEDIIKACVLNILCDCFFYQGLSCQIWVDVWCFHHKSTEMRR
jgi:hypothetical protein